MAEDTDTPAAAPQAAEPARGKAGRQRVFHLGPDRRGAAVNGALYTLYAVVSLYIAVVVAEPRSVWFYVFYFLTFLSIFQGFTVVARHCLHLTPRSAVRVEVAGKKVRLTRRDGKELELSRDADYTRNKGVLVLQGRTHDNQKVSEVIRQGSLGEEGFEGLLDALKRIR